jgi:hypothetical protein
VKRLFVIIFAFPLLLGMGIWPKSDKEACSDLIDTAWEELKAARADNVIGGLRLAKATGLLTQARVRYEAGNYESCVHKAKRAREVIRSAAD